MNDRAALELALAANPDDFATHAAYADLLTEQGDPRGDYIRLQLALEDRHQPIERLRAMEQEAFELSQRHQSAWLGPLAAHADTVAWGNAVGTRVTIQRPNVEFTMRRGWLNEVRIRNFSPEVSDALVACPIARLVGDLTVQGGMLVTRAVLEALPNVTRLSCESALDEVSVTATAGAWFHPVTERPLANLLVSLLPRLRYLTLRTQACGDEGVARLIDSGLLNQLRGLDLCQCAITDDGAQSLAEHPAVAKLDYLHLDDNHISPIGIDALAAVGVVISQRQYLGPTPGVDIDDGEIAF